MLQLKHQTVTKRTRQAQQAPTRQPALQTVTVRMRRRVTQLVLRRLLEAWLGLSRSSLSSEESSCSCAGSDRSEESKFLPVVKATTTVGLISMESPSSWGAAQELPGLDMGRRERILHLQLKSFPVPTITSQDQNWMEETQWSQSYHRTKYQPLNSMDSHL